MAREPGLLARARATLDRWLERYPDGAPAALLEWKALLRLGLADIAARVAELDEDAVHLRKSSPLTTLLSEEERQRVFAAFRLQVRSRAL